MTRYNQFLCVIGLTLMVGCTDCSTTSDVTASVESPVSNATASVEPSVSIPEIPAQSCDDGMNGGVWEGDITTEEELLAAKYCVEINGSILLEDLSNIREIDFPVLERMTGRIELTSIDDLLSVSLPVLASVDAFSIYNNPSLTTISIPRLMTVEGGTSISRNHDLTTVLFPVLVRSDYISISISDSLTEIIFPMLEHIDNIWLFSLDSLTKIDFPMVEQCRNIGISYVWSLTEIKFPMLERVN